MNSLRTTLFFLFFLLTVNTIIAQDKTIVSLEAQAYPTGFIFGLGGDLFVGDKDYLHLKLGMNIFDHRDLGVQDKETGDGYGFSVGYRRFLNENKSAWRWGIKTDLWFNSVDWENLDDPVNPLGGTSDIIVLQPTAELSYAFNTNGFIIAPSLSFGVEWNIKTDGEPTGEGLILLAGVQIGKSF